ncbi:MAG TPA: ChbG/HpnK family deacetylase, partial [Beijerinckiaceae bacterium]|nr:ChbG/HpnK family deacetylase [Beijerinckiaceae bacterium]
GRLSATSAMTTRPGWPGAARALAGMDRRVCVGLHLDLTLGPPLGSMPSFAPAGAFPTIGRVVASALRRTLPLEEIRQEIARQLDLFEVEFGSPPAFVDGHQHVHALPGVAAALLDALEGRKLAGRLWLRDPADRLSRILTRRLQVFKASAVAGLCHGFARQARARGFGLNNGFSGFSSFDPARDYADDFAHYLAAPGPRHLIMCHPGGADSEIAGLDAATLSRPRELAFLLSDDFRKLLIKMGRSLAPGSEFTLS